MGGLAHSCVNSANNVQPTLKYRAVDGHSSRARAITYVCNKITASPHTTDTANTRREEHAASGGKTYLRLVSIRCEQRGGIGCRYKTALCRPLNCPAHPCTAPQSWHTSWGRCPCTAAEIRSGNKVFESPLRQIENRDQTIPFKTTPKLKMLTRRCLVMVDTKFAAGVVQGCALGLPTKPLSKRKIWQ